MATLLVLLAAATVGVGAGSWFEAKRLGGWQQRRDFRRFRRTGTVAPGARTDLWIEALERGRQTTLHPWRMIAGTLLVLVLVILILVGLSLVLGDDDPDEVSSAVLVAGTVLPPAVVVAATLGFLTVLGRRRLPRLEEQIATLHEHQADSR